MELSLRKIFVGIAVVLVALGGWYYTHTTGGQKLGTDYNRLRDLTVAYDAKKEIAEAEKKLTAAKPVPVIRLANVDKKVCALTFDGLADTATNDRILDLLNKFGAKGTFFVEGINSAAEPKTVTAIIQGGQKVGNFTYVGLAHLEKVQPRKALEELCTTQKVLKITTDFAPKFFKAPETTYTEGLLKEAEAVGLKAAVETTSFIEPAKLTTQEAANAFVAALRPGSIVSLRLGIPGEIKPEKGKTDQRPAIDKQPGLEAMPAPARQANAADALEKVLTALKNQKYEMVFVEDFLNKGNTAPAAADPKKAAPAPKKAAANILSLDTIVAFVKANLTISTAYAAAPAEEIKMVNTIEQTVPFTFTGINKPTAVRNVLGALKETNSTGTFFVTEQEIKRQGPLVREILNQGNQLGIAIRPRASEGYDQIKKSIQNTHNLLANNYGVNTNLVKQFSGAIKPEAKQAIGDLGYKLIGQTINAVQSRHLEAKTSDEVMKDIFGARVYSVGRGWIVQIRMDYYKNENLAADVFRAIKKNKIDNIAYRSYYDTPETNPHNNSSYKIKPVGSVLNGTKDLWTYPVPKNRILPSMEPTPILKDAKDAGDKELMKELKKRYIGFKWVNEDDRMLGFSASEAWKLDMTGRIHTNDPVIFFSFDDWGTDAAVNKLLYVFRKHNVKGNFFVLTHNVLDNPNLLRAIAMEGHDICAHSNMHRAMAVRKNGSSRQYPTQSEEEMLEDYKTCYERLLAVTGDIDYKGKPVLTKFFRPPTLAISKKGVKALFANGYEYIVAGAASTEDYSAPDLKTMLNRLTDVIYQKGKVRKGSAIVMHMSDTSKYTALALDMLFTANEKRADGDPAKFVPGLLSDYLVPGYDQSQPFQYK